MIYYFYSILENGQWTHCCRSEIFLWVQFQKSTNFAARASKFFVLITETLKMCIFLFSNTFFLYQKYSLNRKFEATFQSEILELMVWQYKHLAQYETYQIFFFKNHSTLHSIVHFLFPIYLFIAHVVLFSYIQYTAITVLLTNVYHFLCKENL